MSKKTWAGGAISIAFLVAIAIALWPALFRSPDRNRPVQSRELDAQGYEMSVRAAALLENNRFDEAIAIFEKLIESYPKDIAYKRNMAIGALAAVSEQIRALELPQSDRDTIRRGLPALLDRAGDLIQQLIAASPDDAIAYQLDVMLEQKRISLLDPIIADDLRLNLYTKLGEYVRRFPANAFLTIELDNLAETIGSDDPKQRDELINALLAVHKAHPRNIYLLRLLMLRLAQASDKRLVDWVDPLVELLRPYQWQWMMNKPPDDLNQLVAAKALASTDFDTAKGIINQWLNISNSTTGNKADSKLLRAHELSFIDLSNIQSASERIKSVAATAPAVSFEPLSVELPAASGVRFFDWNVDTKPELLIWSERTLKLIRVDADLKATELQTLEMPSEIIDVVPADLFEVDAQLGTKARIDSPTQTLQEKLSSRLRHETIRDLIVIEKEGISIVTFEPGVASEPKWSVLKTEVGLEVLKNVTAVLPIDFEADGDLDLAIVADGRVRLLENLGNRRFHNVDDVSMFADDKTVVTAIAIADYDRDVDLDILVSHTTGFGVLENILHGQFRYRELDGDWAGLKNAKSLCVADLDNSASWDYIAAGAAGITTVTTIGEPGSAPSVKLKRSISATATGAVVGDWNNDGWIDVAMATDRGLSAGVNQVAGEVALQKIAPESASASANPTVADWNGDGRLDLAVIQEGRVVLWRNADNSNRKFFEMRLKGISDGNGGGRNNQYAVGSTIEVYGPLGYQARIVEDDAVHFGLNNSDAFGMRALFVNGLTQGRIDPASNQMLEEVQVLTGSCPFLYTWDGTRWSLFTDLLWNAPIGLQVERGKPLRDRRWEYLLVPGSSLQPIDGAYELRITEELWETAYFDHVALYAIDHPADEHIASNEKVGPGAIAAPGWWSYKQNVAPKSVRDSQDRDWQSQLLEIDGKYALPMQHHICQGLVDTHWLEYDFGVIGDNDAQLYLTGWIYPTDTALNMAIEQNPDIDGPRPPSLWTVGPDGEFHERMPFIGFPGGKPKTIVVPLANVFETDDHRVRIVHSSEIYWDQAFVARGQFHSISEVATLPLIEAHLDYRGFSEHVPRAPYEPHWYDYNRKSTSPAWAPMAGLFTRYGNVGALIERDDDLLVVMGAGDEMRIRFRVPEQPLKPGWVRDFVLHNVGWDKDANLNTLEGQSSLPLPFSKMSQYPPTYQDNVEAKRVEQLHRSTLTREQSPRSFWKPTLQQ